MKYTFFILSLIVCVSCTAQSSFVPKRDGDTKVSTLWDVRMEKKVAATIKQLKLEKSITSYRVNGYIYPVYTDGKEAYCFDEYGNCVRYNEFIKTHVPK